MSPSILQIIGKVNPKLYASNGSDLLKEYGSAEKIPVDKVKPQPIKYSMSGGKLKFDKEGMEAKHTLVYDSPTDTLEPIYFFIIDLMKDFGLDLEKLTDNFSSSPGSSHFGEMGQRASVMQQQGSKLLADINTVLRSLLNLIYDLREFKIRLQTYEDLNDSEKKEAAILSLKQLWMDKVDMQKGNSSLKAMALGQAGFVTLLDAFLAARTSKDVQNLDLNERVKRILIPRLSEFENWINHSKMELTKRYEIERTYLKSQVNSLKIYTRWAKPYLQATHDLEMTQKSMSPELVKMFNTLLLELTILGKNKTKGSYEHKYKSRRDYYQCILVDFNFRGIPQRTQQGYVTGGKAEVTFSAYALNDDELKKIKQELDDSDVNSALKLIEGITDESLGQLKDDLDYFLGEEEQKQIENKKTKDSSNPFLALIGYYDKAPKNKKTSKKENKDAPIIKDNWVEKNYFRETAANDAKAAAFTLFDVYKKAHGMPSYT